MPLFPFHHWAYKKPGLLEANPAFRLFICVGSKGFYPLLRV
ncbi:hypothetical protein GCWU000325_00698 [Alloprevotella tannerae ATCC 51259]|uniref:Uncharacterized protein n=1 Tax=Alloprevotella tannerae ATCC 51259 TaxID=626522 RepID=C9LER7_9BACT|nr:hypothetical protein GCWU000325_00698 [Alloprevotella tannerae ATCC 51259]